MGAVLHQKFEYSMLAISFRQNIRRVIFPINVHHVRPGLDQPFTYFVLASANAVVEWGLAFIVLSVNLVACFL